jgi:osmotically-inducible protein OsmY
MNETVQLVESEIDGTASDAQLLRNLRAELDREPAMGAEHVHLVVQDAIAILSGSAATSEARAAIRSAAQHVVGIRDVYDGIRICPDSGDTDVAIQARIRAMLELDAGVLPDRLTVSVSHGHVALGGHVEWPAQANAAVAAAHRVRGVRGVTSDIHADGVPAPAAIRGRIVLAFQQASEADAAAIAITVEGGVVRLSGKLPGSRERDLAETTVRALPGVTLVDNAIEIL